MEQIHKLGVFERVKMKTQTGEMVSVGSLRSRCSQKQVRLCSQYKSVDTMKEDAKAMHLKRRQKTLCALKAAIDILKIRKETISKKRVSEVAGLSKGTVERYWIHLELKEKEGGRY
ncbi:hypothetical protein AAFX24_27420 [Vibrio mediterranei]|uniref:hypothetical protein n=1 Tax=Vibrio mediterranei TaxID=689 RepID=UPI0038CF06E2